ncbi:hypothetical protein TNIN_482101 [Trichonephila inaurata madagascariensis]|uniref:Uncharacterized protein n=1 Tax=Trichonephila inaurata madagascariensis TaxID=2747483 RepID=A0A8X7C3N2_9ARAC|nr:hypothetical protein TNIN_482101 [Trichonephila inaurata madagascariensis]
MQSKLEEEGKKLDVKNEFTCGSQIGEDERKEKENIEKREKMKEKKKKTECVKKFRRRPNIRVICKVLYVLPSSGHFQWD